MKPSIVIDAGHGGKDPGALGPNGEREKDVTLSVALMMGAMLADVCDVFYTRKTDTFLELTQRANIANELGADLFLSIHCNSGPEGQGDGFEVFTSIGQTASDPFATDLFLSYAEAYPTLRKRVDTADGDVDKEARFTVLTATRMKAALFELEFIHTQIGAAFLTLQVNQAKMAKALSNGVRKHIGAPPVGVAAPAPSSGQATTLYGLPGILQRMEGLSAELKSLIEKGAA